MCVWFSKCLFLLCADTLIRFEFRLMSMFVTGHKQDTVSVLLACMHAPACTHTHTHIHTHTHTHIISFTSNTAQAMHAQ